MNITPPYTLLSFGWHGRTVGKLLANVCLQTQSSTVFSLVRLSLSVRPVHSTTNVANDFAQSTSSSSLSCPFHTTSLSSHPQLRLHLGNLGKAVTDNLSWREAPSTPDQPRPFPLWLQLCSPGPYITHILPTASTACYVNLALHHRRRCFAH